ncbi:MAG TPA: bifunctional 4-hydroxy-2-oxoglutarate aldolase/2-dehydro-3-deoxy-phosphogluconate aldolase, partial [Thermoplasmata archaeon]|nr:bifunctional 4-hydroxy-2-oxoglutarate aldolase/2-dehydro-3-deoxy-phosphogluconate aldolase [Thermoplasmata archaeon]
LGVACIPGAYTPAEMIRADRAGAALVKLFPAPANGPEYVKQILGPLPHLKIVPTAGVDEKNAAAYLRAGAWAVGFTTSLFSAADIEARARELLAACWQGVS